MDTPTSIFGLNLPLASSLNLPAAGASFSAPARCPAATWCVTIGRAAASRRSPPLASRHVSAASALLHRATRGPDPARPGPRRARPSAPLARAGSRDAPPPAARAQCFGHRAQPPSPRRSASSVTVVAIAPSAEPRRALVPSGRSPPPWPHASLRWPCDPAAGELRPAASTPGPAAHRTSSPATAVPAPDPARSGRRRSPQPRIRLPGVFPVYSGVYSSEPRPSSKSVQKP
nr:transcription initiation factor TFIID subunit 4-like [Aegilops tauschii subsp. strangulata]